ncbi:hypothetical protein [Alistipes sp.]|uniref:hypothetical protein n=1 Tax=Alistipes sp. TaxID=1872444 RepID=UPI003AF0D63A
MRKLRCCRLLGSFRITQKKEMQTRSGNRYIKYFYNIFRFFEAHLRTEKKMLFVFISGFLSANFAAKITIQRLPERDRTVNLRVPNGVFCGKIGL